MSLHNEYIRTICKGIFILLIVSIISVGISTAISHTSHPQRPNIVLISIDTLRPDHIATYGYSKTTSPFIDSLLSKSTWARNMITTIPVTTPSFAALFTGRHPFSRKNEVGPNYAIKIDSSTPTLVSILKSNGYETAGFVTNRLLWNDTFAIASAFDRYEQTDVFIKNEYDGFIDQAVKWLESPHETPFFYWIHLMEPHAPYIPKKDHQCDNKSSDCKPFSQYDLEELEKKRESLAGCTQKPLPRQETNSFIDLYDTEIRDTDDTVKRIYSILASRNLIENTLVILYSDHGEGFDHNYYFEHGKLLYDSSLKVLFSISSPAHDSSGPVDIPMQSIDITPTVLDLLGIYGPRVRFDGISMAEYFKHDVLSRIMRFFRAPRLLYAMNADASKFSVTDGVMSYMYSLNNACISENQKEALYDTRTDPDQLDNIFGSRTQNENKLKQALMKTLHKYGYIDQESQSKPFDWSYDTYQSDVLEKLKSLGY